MKISILLPYKENFSPIYPGAVSLFVKDTCRISKYKKNITIYGATNLKKKYDLNYFDLNLKKKELLSSQSKTYVKKFTIEEQKQNSDIIEVHNRPIYIKYLKSEKINSKFVLYFHNDPLSMSGSKTTKDRIWLLQVCEKIIFNSQWSKKRFLQNIKSSFINSEKLLVIYQSANKSKINDTIDYSRDFNFDYFALKTLEKAYLMKVNGVIIERIQHMLTKGKPLRN